MILTKNEILRAFKRKKEITEDNKFKNPESS